MKKFLLARTRVAALLGSLAIGVGHVPPMHAQSRPMTRSRPEFEVALVKLVDHPVPMHPYRLDINHGTLRIDAVPLRFIIGLAYAVQTERVLGWPGWLNDERYDIQVKAENHALSENLTKWAYLRGFGDSAHGEEFEVADRKIEALRQSRNRIIAPNKHPFNARNSLLTPAVYHDQLTR